MKLAQYKLPIRTKFVRKSDLEIAVSSTASDSSESVGV